MIYRFTCDIEVETEGDGEMKYVTDNEFAPNNEWLRSIFGWVPTKFVKFSVTTQQGEPLK